MVTRWLVALSLAGYAGEVYRYGFSPSGGQLRALGAVAPIDLHHPGQWWRVVVSNFLQN